jgi:arsenical pump membrane protein
METHRWLALGLLLLGTAGAIRPPKRSPTWAVPAVAVVLDLAVGVSNLGAVGQSVRPLLAPVAFLLAAVPLAVMLDKLGLFSALAWRVIAKGAGPGYLWALAALVTTVLNLDCAVVLLTPLYVQVARRQGWDVIALAAQPVLLACLASSALPVSNLTNLIAVSWSGATTAQFLAHLALPSAVATIVGWWMYRATVTPAGLNSARLERAGLEEPDVDPGIAGWGPRVGGLIVLAVVVGFTCGSVVGAQPWSVAVGADVALVLVLVYARRAAGRGPGWKAEIPWRTVPAGTAIMVLALGALATAAARFVPVGSLLQGQSPTDLARDSGLAALGANVVNNLPTLLVALPRIGHRTVPSLWAVLLGVNMGPVVLVTGSLASLLWLSTLRRLGVPARPRDFTRLGVRAGLPAAAAAVAVATLLRVAGVA